jgi:hypothetical protein
MHDVTDERRWSYIRSTWVVYIHRPSGVGGRRLARLYRTYRPSNAPYFTISAIPRKRLNCFKCLCSRPRYQKDTHRQFICDLSLVCRGLRKTDFTRLQHAVDACRTSMRDMRYLLVRYLRLMRYLLVQSNPTCQRNVCDFFAAECRVSVSSLIISPTSGTEERELMRAVGTAAVFTCEVKFTQPDDELVQQQRQRHLASVSLEWFDKNDVRIQPQNYQGTR